MPPNLYLYFEGCYFIKRTRFQHQVIQEVWDTGWLASPLVLDFQRLKANPQHHFVKFTLALNSDLLCGAAAGSLPPDYEDSE